jgi:hypothetical protein
MDYMVQNPLHTTARLDCIPTFVVVRLENCLRCVVSGMGVLPQYVGKLYGDSSRERHSPKSARELFLIY